LFVRISGLCDFICVDELRGVGICSIFAPLRKGGKPGFRRLTWGFLRFSECVLIFLKYILRIRKSFLPLHSRMGETSGSGAMPGQLKTKIGQGHLVLF